MNMKLSGPQYPVGIRTPDRSARSLVAVPLRHPGSRCLVMLSAHTGRYEINIYRVHKTMKIQEPPQNFRHQGSTWSKFHTENHQTLGATAQNFVARANWTLEKKNSWTFGMFRSLTCYLQQYQALAPRTFAVHSGMKGHNNSVKEFYVRVTMLHRNKFLYNKTN